MMWWHNEIHWASWIAMFLIMVAFWSLVAHAVIALFHGNQSSRADDPARILAEQFVRGQIDLEEYHARQRALRDAR